MESVVGTIDVTISNVSFVACIKKLQVCYLNLFSITYSNMLGQIKNFREGVAQTFSYHTS